MPHSSLTLSAADRTRTTYRYECWRALSSGIMESAGSLFLLLIAVRCYEAGPWSKGLVAVGGSLGLLLCPWWVSRVAVARWPAAKAAGAAAALGAASFLTMALLPVLPVFVAGSILALTTSAVAIPLMTQVYQDNYPERERGRRFARTMMLRIAAAAAFSDLAGRALSGRLDHFRWLLVLFALASGFAAFCFWRIPSQPLHNSSGTHPFRALRFVVHDRVFRQTLICWMFLGFGLLMMGPLRVEYLANPKYGVTIKGQVLTAGLVALITGVVPNIARLLLNPVWGWLFDHMNFFVLRLSLNLGFALGIVSFFITSSVPGLFVGAVLFGISNAGGDVAWSLWVTKFAPPPRVADYMSVHTFFTGLRGVVAPLVGFYMVGNLPPHVLGWVTVGLIVIGSAFIVPEVRFGRSRAVAEAPSEEALAELSAGRTPGSPDGV